MLPYGRKNPLPFPLFRSGHMSAICARLSKGKGVIHKRVENRRLSTLLCARAASAQFPSLRKRKLKIFIPKTKRENQNGSLFSSYASNP